MRRTLAVALVAAAAAVVPTAPAEALVTGVVRVVAESAPGPAQGSVTVGCPAGTRLLGVGADVVGGFGGVLLDRVRPNAALTSVTVHAAEDEGPTSENWWLRAYAVCGTAPAGLELVTATTASTSDPTRKATASCPSGKRVLGAAGELAGAPRQLLLTGVVPNEGLSKVAVSATEDATGTTAAWRATAYAICAAPVPGLGRATATGAPSSSASNGAVVGCPSGTALLSAGGSADGPAGRVLLESLSVNSGGFTSVGAFEGGPGTTNDWTVSVHGICAGAAAYAEQSTGETAGGVSLSGECDEGREPLGTGARLERLRGRGGLTSLLPYAATTSTSPFASIDTLLSVQAVCATPLVGAQPVTVQTPVLPAADRTLTATCPAGTKVVAGYGGQAGQHLVFLQALRPSTSLRSVTVRVTGSELDSGPEWSGRVTALCAPVPAGLELVTATSATTSEESNLAVAACPAGKHVVGTGGAVSVPSPVPAEVLLNGIAISPGLDKVTVSAYEDVSGYDGDWSVSAYAICVSR